jgi:two-component system sensor histidine kinase KdpD
MQKGNIAMLKAAFGKVDNESLEPAFDTDRERFHRQMLSSVSHDLKTPLASIIGALEVLHNMKDRLTEDKKAVLGSVALREAYRLNDFVTNILDMARLENGVIKANLESAEINAVMRNCLSRTKKRLRDCTVTFSESAPIEVSTDTILLSRVVCLVLDNADKYGGTPLALHVECGRGQNNFAFIKIQDNGNGIPEKQIDLIFSKYTRFAKEDQQNAGTGLGLAISRHIMALLGGEITAANDRNGGAVFTLRVPLLTAGAKRHRDILEPCAVGE